MSSVTVIIPTKNEEENLPRCLKALKSFEHILVVDSNSDDRTEEIVNKAGVEFIQFSWNGGYPKKRNWILQHYNFVTDWVLFLDADEQITDDFETELNSAIDNNNFDGYWLAYNNYFQGCLQRHGIPFEKLALFRVGKGQYERISEDRWSNLDMEIHEHPLVDGKVGRITSPIVHHDYKGLHAYIARHNEYSSWEAQRYLDISNQKGNDGLLTARQKKKYRNIASWWWSPAYFIMNYFIKLGFLDGRSGFVFSVLKAVYFFEVRCKILELKNNQKYGIKR